MTVCLRTALIESLSAHPGPSGSRLETPSMLMMGLIHGRTVDLSHVASQCHGPACCASEPYGPAVHQAALRSTG